MRQTAIPARASMSVTGAWQGGVDESVPIAGIIILTVLCTQPPKQRLDERRWWSLPVNRAGRLPTKSPLLAAERN